MQQQNLKPPYEVEVLKGERVERMPVWSKGDGFVMQDVTIRNGYMVYFPHHHSVHFSSKEALTAAGFSIHGPGAYVDMDSGEVVDMPAQQSLKAESRRVTKPKQRGN